MKAVVYQGAGNVVVKDITKPKPEQGEVLLKPLYVGMCFSDVQAYEREIPYVGLYYSDKEAYERAVKSDIGEV